MKKLYVLTFALLLGASAQSQIVDFENYLPTVDTFDNGSAGSGDFLFYELQLSNNYNMGGWWTGFAISNTTDVTTPGYLNQYSAWPGSGADTSESYAVMYQDGLMKIEQSGGNVSIDHFKITNATYTALSMRDGDGFGKQFGSIYNADSTVVDGTNGEDFYRVWVYGESDGGQYKDSMLVYLADYRFADDTQDYIVDTWLDVDLTTFGFVVHEVTFKFESSDTTGGWINTPTYFAVDDVELVVYIGLEENQLENVTTYPNPATNQISIKGEEGELTITSLNGSVMFQGAHSQLSSIDVSNFSNGIYVIHLVNASGSYTNRFIKN